MNNYKFLINAIYPILNEKICTYNKVRVEQQLKERAFPDGAYVMAGTIPATTSLRLHMKAHTRYYNITEEERTCCKIRMVIQ